MIEKVKVFQLDEWEWWAGTTLAETVEAAKKHYGADGHDYEDARELDDYELDKFMFFGEESAQSFRGRLEWIQRIYEAPMFFAMTEA